MAAEITKRGNKPSGHIVRPQAVSDQTYLDNIYEIFNQLPFSSGTSPKHEEKETIVWVRFEHADVNDLSIHLEEGIRDVNITPILLVLGYTNGVQVWCILANGEAIEVLSLRQGPVKILKLLPTPTLGKNSVDTFAQKRPLIAIVDANSSPQFSNVDIVSLKSGDILLTLQFKVVVNEILCNKRVMAVSLEEKIHLYDVTNFKEKMTIVSCYRCPGPNVNPMALGSQWLAYADRRLVSIHQTCGGVTGECTPSYVTQVFTAAKTLTHNISKLGETLSHSLLTGYKPAPRQPGKKEPREEDGVAGVVTILDTQADISGEVNIDEDSEGIGIIAHFPAHVRSAVSAMAFDPSGALLVTACRDARMFHVFRIFPHPASSTLGAVHHLYTLHRGDTTARVQDMAFSLDSRWVTISTLRGTTHVFPITPYGGQVCMRTHTSARMVNRLSRFQKSAGLHEDSSSLPASGSQAGRNSPVLSSQANPTPPRHGYDSHPSINYQSTFTGRMGNPRLPPYPHPTPISPLAQIRLPLGNTGQKEGSIYRSPSCPDFNMALAATFAAPRAWVLGSPNLARDKRVCVVSDRRPVDSLFVITCHGNLIEYSLEPKAQANLPKIADDSPIQLVATQNGQWPLLRSPASPDVKPPLQSSNLLMIVQDMFTNDRHNNISESQLQGDDLEERWLSQVEIITHAGPHRRLWMGPQFNFLTFQQPDNTTVLTAESSALLSQTPPSDCPSYASSIYKEELEVSSLSSQPNRSEPIVVPPRSQHQSSLFLIEATSGSFEQPSGVLEVRGNWPEAGFTPPSQVKLQATIADAMQDFDLPSRKTPGGLIKQQLQVIQAKRQDLLNFSQSEEEDLHHSPSEHSN